MYALYGDYALTQPKGVHEVIMRLLVKRADVIGENTLTAEQFKYLATTFDAKFDIDAVEYVPMNVRLDQVDLGDTIPQATLLVTRRGEFGILSNSSKVWERKIKV